jgi:hypothetical protein
MAECFMEAARSASSADIQAAQSRPVLSAIV